MAKPLPTDLFVDLHGLDLKRESQTAIQRKHRERRRLLDEVFEDAGAVWQQAATVLKLCGRPVPPDPRGR